MKSETEIPRQHSQATATALAAEALEFALPHQRMLICLFALAHRYHLDLPLLIDGLADELPYRLGFQARGLADQIRQGIEPIAALQSTPLLIPAVDQLTLQLGRDTLNLDILYASVLAHSPTTNAIEFTGGDDGSLAKLGRLLIKVIFFVSLTSFLCLRIIPQFKMMLDEFDVEMSASMKLLIKVAIGFADFWFVIPLMVLLFLPFYYSGFLRFLRRLNLLTWRRLDVAPAVRRRRSLAIATESERSISEAIHRVLRFPLLQTEFKRLNKANDRINNGQTEWSAMAAEGIISDREAKALAISQNPETQAWLLRWSALDHQRDRSARTAILLRILMGGVHLILGLFALLICVAVFSTLIGIMAELVTW